MLLVSHSVFLIITLFFVIIKQSHSLLNFLFLPCCIPNVTKEEYMTSVEEVWILTTDWPVTDWPHILENFKWPYLQRVIWSLSCLVLGWGFRGRRIEQRYFRLDQIQDGGWQPFWKFQMAKSMQCVIRSTLCMHTHCTYDRRLETYFVRGGS